MTHPLKATLVGFAAAVGSLFLSLPATAIITSGLRPAQIDNTQSGRGGLEFQVVYVDVNLLPAIVCAMLAFIVAFIWMLRRRATKQ